MKTISDLFAAYVDHKASLSLNDDDLSSIARMAEAIKGKGALEPSDDQFMETVANMMIAASK